MWTGLLAGEVAEPRLGVTPCAPATRHVVSRPDGGVLAATELPIIVRRHIGVIAVRRSLEAPFTQATESGRLLTIERLRFAWPGAGRPVLDIPSLELAGGETLFLHGGSGSGKSTLLAAIAGVVAIDPGSLRVAGTDLGTLHGAARDRFRADHLGIVFQLFNLVPYLSALDNVLLPCRFSRARHERAAAEPGGTRSAALRLLGHLGLGERALYAARADELSVGQQQRVAAARALIGNPGLVLADEPTSALDADLKDDFIALLLAECRAAGSTLLFVSHDRGLEPHFDRALDFARVNRAAAGEAVAC